MVLNLINHATESVFFLNYFKTKKSLNLKVKFEEQHVTLYQIWCFFSYLSKSESVIDHKQREWIRKLNIWTVLEWKLSSLFASFIVGNFLLLYILEQLLIRVEWDIIKEKWKYYKDYMYYKDFHNLAQTS